MTSHLRRNPHACAVILLLTLSTFFGCTQPGVSTPQQTLAFPIPSGWTTEPSPTGNPSHNSLAQLPIDLHDPTGACRIQFSRTFSTRPTTAAAADMRAAFDKAGHATTPQPAMSLGGASATHFSVAFPGSNPPATRVVENVYLVSADSHLLTLVTIRSAHCTSSFQPILDNFRL